MSALFCVAAAIHAYTFRASPEPLPEIMFLFLHAAVVVGALVCVVVLVERGARAKDANLTLLPSLPKLRAMPMTVYAIGIAVALYLFINFFVCMAHLDDGHPEVGTEGPFLQNHGDFVRFLSEDEYRRLAAYETRSFSGSWIMFTLFPTALVFLAAKPQDE